VYHVGCVYYVIVFYTLIAILNTKSSMLMVGVKVQLLLVTWTVARVEWSGLSSGKEALGDHWIRDSMSSIFCQEVLEERKNILLPGTEQLFLRCCHLPTKLLRAAVLDLCVYVISVYEKAQFRRI
jgi:hypothetical protein